jgi:hypothetical protein
MPKPDRLRIKQHLKLSVMLALAALLACRSEPGTLDPLRVLASKRAGTTPHEAQAGRLSSGCGSCHAKEEAEWRTSMHRAAFTSADFQSSWAVEPMPFCAECHAPQRRELGTEGEVRGVGCTECHEAPHGHDVLAHGVAHAKVVTKSCTPCHDFPVPNSRAFLQGTEREHAASSFANVPCIECHMSLRDGKGRNHAFFSSRNRDLIAQSLAFGTPQSEAMSIVITVATRGVGHRFPTGDIFRRLSITLVGTDAHDSIVCGETFNFNRNWAAHKQSIRRNSEELFSGDTRLTHEPRTLRAPCTGTVKRVRVVAEYARGRNADETQFTAFETMELFDRTYDL